MGKAFFKKPMVAKFSLKDSGQMNMPEIWTQMHMYKQTGPRAIPIGVQQ